MWQASDGRKQTTPAYWNAIYRERRPVDEVHVRECMDFIGDVRGMDVLDIGGGTTLAGAMEEAGTESFTVVDHSREACDQIIKTRAVPIYSDAEKFLKDKNRGLWDVCVTFGLLEYLPPTFLDLLLERCSAPVLVIGTSSGESYIAQYTTRLVSYAQMDVVTAAAKYGWDRVEFKDKPSHLWAKLWRDKA